MRKLRPCRVAKRIVEVGLLSPGEAKDYLEDATCYHAQLWHGAQLRAEKDCSRRQLLESALDLQLDCLLRLRAEYCAAIVLVVGWAFRPQQDERMALEHVGGKRHALPRVGIEWRANAAVRIDQV